MGCTLIIIAAKVNLLPQRDLGVSARLHCRILSAVDLYCVGDDFSRNSEAGLPGIMRVGVDGNSGTTVISSGGGVTFGDLERASITRVVSGNLRLRDIDCLSKLDYYNKPTTATCRAKKQE